MENTTVIVPVSKLKAHAMSALLTFASVFIPVAALILKNGLDNQTFFTADAIMALVITAVRAAGKAGLQALLLEEITFWKKQVDAAKAEGQITTQLPE